MGKIITTKFIDSNGRVHGKRLDPATFAPIGIDYAHHEIHEGDSFSAHISNSDMDKSEEINICFTTPNSTTYLHALFFPNSSILAEFKICEGATVTASTGTDALAGPQNGARKGSIRRSTASDGRLSLNQWFAMTKVNL